MSSKAENIAQEALDAVANAVQVAREASDETVTTEVLEDFGKLSAEPLLKFCEAAAVQIEKSGMEVMEEGNRLHSDCIGLAGEIRTAAREQAEAILRQTNRARKAAMGITALRDEFRTDVKQEAETVRMRKETPK
jgi:hypothetical protein